MKPRSKFLSVFTLASVLGLALATASQAQTGRSVPSPIPARAQNMGGEFEGDESDPLGDDPAPAKQPGKRAQGRRGNEKDTEGTKAPNRFEADTVIKSKYHLDGDPLEVDPD